MELLNAWAQQNSPTYICVYNVCFCVHHFAEAIAYFGSRDGPGTGPVHLNQIRCSGSEHFLVNCSRPRFGEVSGNCRDHSEDASVHCPSEFMWYH